MFDGDFCDLDLGSRRKPTQWVAVAPSTVVVKKQNQRGRRKANKQKNKQALDTQPQPDEGTSATQTTSEGRRKLSALRGDQLDVYAEKERVFGVEYLAAEDDEGKIEYKLRIIDPSPMRFQQLVTQMKYRLSEGCGECFYYLGVEDDGYPRGLTQTEMQQSLASLRAMAAEVQASAATVKLLPGTKGRQCALVRLNQMHLDEMTYTDLRIAVAGSVDSGKSTLVAVLTHGMDGRPLLDNGRGSARTSVFRHKHEIETGRTSSISQQILGYDEEGKVLNYVGVSSLTPAEIASRASKVVRFIDLGGHEKYLKTALYGLTGMLPDYVALCVCAHTGITTVGREHLAAAFALDIPVLILLTKADTVADEMLTKRVEEARLLLSSAVPHPTHEYLVAPYVTCDADSEAAAELLTQHIQDVTSLPEGVGSRQKCVTPIFAVSSLTGSGLSGVHTFISKQQPTAVQRVRGQRGVKKEVDPGQEYTHFQVDHTFEVSGVGCVVSGTLICGTLAVGQHLALGPTPMGGFATVQATCIQRSTVPVSCVKPGQHATVAIHPVSPSSATTKPIPILETAPQDRRQHPTNSDAPPEPSTSNDRTYRDAYSNMACLAEATLQLPGLSCVTDDSALTTCDEWSDLGDSPCSRGGGVWDFFTSRQGSQAVQPARDSLNEALDASGTGEQGLDNEMQHLQDNAASQSGAGAGVSGAGTEQANVRGVIASSSSADKIRDRDRPQPAVRTNSTRKRSRKGPVLLDCCYEAHPCWEFDAIMVLLGGFWPARGLLSGKWPPHVMSDMLPRTYYSGSGSDSGGGASHQEVLDTSPGRPAKKRRGVLYSPVVHCGSVRQVAQVEAMKELMNVDAQQGSFSIDGYDLTSAVKSASLLQLNSECDAPDGAGGAAARQLTVAATTFRFLHKPEWLQAGVQCIVRDRTEGRIAGVGVISRVKGQPLQREQQQ